MRNGIYGGILNPEDHVTTENQINTVKKAKERMKSSEPKPRVRWICFGGPEHLVCYLAKYQCFGFGFRVWSVDSDFEVTVHRLRTPPSC